MKRDQLTAKFLRKHVIHFFSDLLPNKTLRRPQDRFWIGGGLGVLIFTFSIAIWTASHAYYGAERIWIMLGAIGVAIVAFLLFPIFSVLILKSLRWYPNYFIAAVGGAIGLMMVLKNTRFGMPDPYFYYGGFLTIVAVALVAGSLLVIFSGTWQSFIKYKQVTMMIGLLLGSYYLFFVANWLLTEGKDPYATTFKQIALSEGQSLGLADPSQPGPFEFRKFTYGSGVNKKRPEYGEEVDYISATVNGKYILPSWKNKQAKKRQAYWGFGIERWPINGITWMPEGDGPFPLVLIVHGNHNMEDYSDPGYSYLGELLASRGYITVSVDENFINGSWIGDFRGKELPARAWLLLKHLQQWRDWNEDRSHPLSGKADLENIALIGHSRGGEAVPIAAAFNTLSHFPDDSREAFDFDFGIRSVIAIAPTDYRYDRRVTIENVDYLGIQGSYDSDEDSFFGLRQLQRTSFTDSLQHMKAAVYIHGANHGQFNTGWGRHDAGFPYKMFLNTKPLISGEDQRAFAAVLISAFLETSIRGEIRYAGIFQDMRHAARWLTPDILSMSLYEDSHTGYWADFEEDIELQTANSGRVNSGGFTVWAEDYLQFRAGRHQENHALILGWKQDSIPGTATYSIEFDGAKRLEPDDLLTFSIGAGDPSLLEAVSEDSLKNDLNIILTDDLGNRSAQTLSDYKLVTPRLKIRFLKTKGLTTGRYDNEWEPVLESVFIPVGHFKGVDWTAITSISFEANTDQPGIVMLDRIGVRSANP